ncbi:MAG TPA: hypothetical protein VMT83_17070 [Burkholderiaceae bacterium]|nr:hypothetical protein [Burkholderiaceae bacterium]
MNGTATKRVALYERLPEIYRIRDAEQLPPDQLREYLAAVELGFGAVHESIEALYHDLFIDTCDDWVVPYIADLVGTSHLKGDPWTLRADVADTIALRRRKGTLGALERLAANLTGWACRCVELRENLGWTQHLNHQRPDAGGLPPYGSPAITRFTVPRGGTVPVRDPAMLRLLGTPFDPFAYTADVKSAGKDAFGDGLIHYNLPNLAVFLWRLEAYRLHVTLPLAKGFTNLGPPPAGSNRARFAVYFDLDPLDRPVQLFNTWRTTLDRLTRPDAVPGPMLDARLTTGSEAGNPAAYVSVDVFDAGAAPPTGLDLGEVGLQLYLPQAQFAGMDWTLRGDNLCAWEQGLRRPLQRYEIVVDPAIGRIMFGVGSAAERDGLIQASGSGFDSRIYCGYTYGAPAQVGAHPISRAESPTTFEDQPVDRRVVSALPGGTSLQSALTNIHDSPTPIVVEIQDSLVHPLDIDTLPGATNADGPVAIQLNRSLVIRAAGEQRPIIRLARPLRFRPTTPGDASVAHLVVRFEGVHLARAPGFPPNEPLVARAAVARLEFDGCTLDPGGQRRRDGTREALWPALNLAQPYGFANPADEDAFAPTPNVLLRRSIAGSLALDEGYRLAVSDSIVDAGAGVGDPPGSVYALASATAPGTGWGAPLQVLGATFFGRVRTAESYGSGGIFAQRLEVWNNQKGCLKFCWFSGDADRLPPNHACLHAPDAKLAFTSDWFGDPGYGQLARASDFRVLSRGPNDDAMGAFGFLLEAHKWANLQIRFREFMPVGVRPLLLPVT